MLTTSVALACESGSVPLFGCEASEGRKFIELCSSSPPSQDGYLEYRYAPMYRSIAEKVLSASKNIAKVEAVGKSDQSVGE